MKIKGLFKNEDVTKELILSSEFIESCAEKLFEEGNEDAEYDWEDWSSLIFEVTDDMGIEVEDDIPNILPIELLDKFTDRLQDKIEELR